MDPTRKYFLKLFFILISLFAIQNIVKLAMHWRLPVFIVAMVCLLLALLPPLGRPLHRLWVAYVNATSQGMRFFKGIGLFLLIIASYRLLYLSPVAPEAALTALLSGSLPAGDWRWFAGFGSPLFIVGLIPPLAAFAFAGWMKLAFALQLVVSRIILTLIFIIAVLPVGLVAKLVGKKFLQKNIDPHTPSYWIDRQVAPPNPKQYTRHF